VVVIFPEKVMSFSRRILMMNDLIDNCVPEILSHLTSNDLVFIDVIMGLTSFWAFSLKGKTTT